jgi:hypothetical protein
MQLQKEGTSVTDSWLFGGNTRKDQKPTTRGGWDGIISRATLARPGTLQACVHPPASCHPYLGGMDLVEKLKIFRFGQQKK